VSSGPTSIAPDTDDESPATSRSPEIRADRSPPRRQRASARERLEQLIDDLQRIVREIDDARDEDGRKKKIPAAQKAALLRAMVSPLRLLGQLNGEIGVTESQLVASPIVQRLIGDIVEALKPFPEALRAVREVLAPAKGNAA
jgi:hypothetical protein